MKIKEFLKVLNTVEFFIGVPDSKLKPLCNYLINTYGVGNKHYIAVNEGNAVAIAAGYFLSTAKYPCVYMQNSGIGNIINPVLSLTDKNVFGIPIFYLIGWRGEPNTLDEPQHIKQGEVTPSLLKILDIAYEEISHNTTKEELITKWKSLSKNLSKNKSIAFLVRKDALSYDKTLEIKNKDTLIREEALVEILKHSKGDIIVSTTGKTSREIFEIRENNDDIHDKDFLTVGSMGHASSIALGVSMETQKKVWAIDGDGALLMHMGAMAMIGSKAGDNFVHVVINNGAHESVGGQPSIAKSIDLSKIASGCGYKTTWKVETKKQLVAKLKEVDHLKGPIFIEIVVSIGSRPDLGRPNINPNQNKINFMKYISKTNI